LARVLAVGSAQARLVLVLTDAVRSAHWLVGLVWVLMVSDLP
jgi:hypothetical protein